MKEDYYLTYKEYFLFNMNRSQKTYLPFNMLSCKTEALPKAL